MKRAIRSLLLVGLLGVAPAGAGEPAGDDAWMAALQEAMQQARNGDRDLAIGSLRRMREAAGGNRNRRGIAGLYLGQMLHFARRNHDAQPVLVEAVADLAAVRLACDDFVAKALAYAVTTSVETHALAAAQTYAEAQWRCVEPRLASGSTPPLGELALLAQVQRWGGREAEALAGASRAATLFAARDPDRRDATRASLVDGAHGMALAANGRWADALPLLERRLAALRDLQRARSLEYALTQADYALALRGVGATARADQNHAEALALLRAGGRAWSAWTADVESRYAAR